MKYGPKIPADHWLRQRRNPPTPPLHDEPQQPSAAAIIGMMIEYEMAPASPADGVRCVRDARLRLHSAIQQPKNIADALAEARQTLESWR